MLTYRPVLRAASLTILSGLTFFAAYAQAPAGPPPPLDPTYTPTLTFDVATIRASDRSAGGGIHVGVISPPRTSEFTASNFSAKSLIQLAYGYSTPVVGGPDWLGSEFFNVQAKSDAATDALLKKLTLDQSRMEKQHMIQQFLAERLGLKLHWENRQSAIFELVIAKGGSKLTELKQASAEPGDPKPAALPAADIDAAGSARGLEFKASAASTKAIAAMLVSQVEKPIVDKTGLDGTYQFTLHFGREWSSRNPESWPDLFTAVQDQLGLKLEATKALIPVLVIDHIDLPSAN